MSARPLRRSRTVRSTVPRPNVRLITPAEPEPPQPTADGFEAELAAEVRAEIDSEPVPEDQSTANSPRRRPPLRTLRRRGAPWSKWDLLAVAVLVLALIGLGVGGVRWWHAHELDRAHQAALAAARQTTVDFVTISASSVDSDLARIAAGATGDFKDEFTRDTDQVRQAVVENKVESTGQVLRAALVSGDLDSAVVLVAIDASVKNVGAPDGRLSHYRIQVDLTLDAQTGRWLVNRLQFVG